ncbi:MAG TPA: response regulator [Cyanophyceae cyanobacterium]
MTTILVIEDDDNVREILVEILRAEGFNVIAAEDGQLGLELAQDKLPNLIICDIMMPKLSGYEVLSQLQQSPSTATIPFIFLTAKSAKTDLRQGMALGADDYLTKPFTRDELLAAIAARLEKQGILAQKSQKQLDELRGSLFHSLPHELRTPLNGILGLSRLLIESYDITDRDEALEMLEEIYTSGERLYRLTQNFLLYADLELIAKDPARIRALHQGQDKIDTQKVIREIATQKAKKTNRISDLILELQEIMVSISEEKFRKIIEEIIDNAFKFSTTSTLIEVKTNSQENIFILYVTNRGRGMTAEQIAHLGAGMQFERKLYEQQGSGLGLVIAKRLVELHGGNLAIDSIPSQETIVRVALPIERES